MSLYGKLNSVSFIHIFGGLMRKRKYLKNRILSHTLCFLVIIYSFLLPIFSLDAYADKYTDAMETNKTLPIQSNETKNWPPGPVVSSYSAILIDADTGVILYEKNSHSQMYPASTTKLMTCLLAMEDKNSNLNDLVSFSYDAVMSIPPDGSNMGMDAGEKMTLEECLYGVLVVSANEVANAIAEYVSGDNDSFVKLMNERAKELGCVNTHFANPHGYFDENHYTSAYDLAQIGRAFFSNELLAKISRTPTYHWYATEYQPDDIILGSTNYYMRGRKDCEGLVGSKTGFTDESRQCLITCAERNGLRLICVVMSTETPYQYDDTNTLFNYGFSNFEKIKVSDYETKYTVTKDSFFDSNSVVFGDSNEIISLDTTSSIIIPKNISFDELSSKLTYTSDDSGKIATLTYSFNGVYLGEASILYTDTSEAFSFDESFKVEEEEQTVIYLDKILYALGGILIVVFLILVIRKVLSLFHFGVRIKKVRRKKKQRTKGPNYRIDKKRINYHRKNMK